MIPSLALASLGDRAILNIYYCDSQHVPISTWSGFGTGELPAAMHKKVEQHAVHERID